MESLSQSAVAPSSGPAAVKPLNQNKPLPQKPKRVVIDECVGRCSPLWQAFFQWLGEPPSTLIYLREKHQGIPDGAILGKLLEVGDILVTADRILHNRACADGFTSFTLNPSGELTHKPLGGLPRCPSIAPAPAGALRDDYIHELSAVTSALRQGMRERELKGYRTCRRRIRAAFGGRDNISQLALTIGDLNTPAGALCGFYLQVAGQGRKGLEASEGYSVDRHGALSPTISPIRALVEIYLLDLEDVRTEAYFISEESFELCRRILAGEFIPAEGTLERGLQYLLLGFDRLAIHPCRKGPFFDPMQRKLRALGRGQSNEVKSIDFVELSQGMQRLLASE